MADVVRIISADSHVDIQQERVLANLPEQYHDAFREGQMRALQKMMEQKPHKQRQQAENQEAPETSSFLGARETPWEAAGRPGAYDPVARLSDMDIDQVEAEVLYTDVQGGAGFYEAGDDDAITATFEAWNSAAVEFCSHDPKRLLAVYPVPIHNIAAGVQEVERLAAEGARALQLPLYPLDIGFAPYWDKVYDPLWDTIEETGLTISQHVGAMQYLLDLAVHDPTPPKGIMQSLPPIFMAESLAGWIVSGIFERHPDSRSCWSRRASAGFPTCSTASTACSTATAGTTSTCRSRSSRASTGAATWRPRSRRTSSASCCATASAWTTSSGQPTTRIPIRRGPSRNK